MTDCCLSSEFSKKIATSLRGRSLATEISPYSFNEFISSKKISIERSVADKKTQDNLKKIFYQYLSEGGFLEITTYNSDERGATLQGYVDIVIYRDIIERYQVKHPKIVKYVITSMIHNVSNPFSINKFYNKLKTQGYKTNKDVLYEYAD